MKALTIALALSAVIFAGACSDNQTQTAANEPAVTSEENSATSTELTPEQLGELGAELEKNPDQARQLIAKRGLNEEQFEEAMRDLSEDPAASQRYAQAYQKARG